MKPIKKIVSVVLVICIMLGLGCTSFAKADAAAEETTSLILMAEGLKSAYDASVIARMDGRAGAATPKGAKGISFEIMLKDKLNLKDFFNFGTKTALSESSTDQVADLVTKKDGAVRRLIQCKDGNSDAQIRKTLNAVENGKYADAELYSTSEFAEKFNAKAAEEGIEKQAVDSGISTKRTSSIADKALGKINVSEFVSTTLKTATIGGAVMAALSAVESIVNGDDFSHVAGNVTANTATAMISTALCPLSGAAMRALLTSLGATSTVAAASGTVISVVVPCAAGHVLYVFIEKSNIKDVIASFIDYAGDNLVKIYDNIADYISELDIKGTVSQAADFVSNKAQSGAAAAKGLILNTKDSIANVFSRAVGFIKNLF